MFLIIFIFFITFYTLFKLFLKKTKNQEKKSGMYIKQPEAINIMRENRGNKYLYIVFVAVLIFPLFFVCKYNL